MKNLIKKYMSKNLIHTVHVDKRMQQRAVNQTQIELIEMFGDYKYQKGGSYYAFIPEKVLSELRHALDKINNVRAIYDGDDTLITVMHKTRRVHFVS
jgi:hypothetical protein